MRLVQTLISLLIVTIGILSAYGIVWWQSPPEPLAGYTRGGQAILAILILGCLVGLWRLWKPVEPSA